MSTEYLATFINVKKTGSLNSKENCSPFRNKMLYKFVNPTLKANFFHEEKFKIYCKLPFQWPANWQQAPKN